jgi:Domain of unknown function (DUF4129)/Protein of unknown function (DUF2637)
MAPDHGRKSTLKRPLLVGLAVTGLVVVAAAATPEGWAFLGVERPRRVVVPDPPPLFAYTLVVAVVLVAVIAYTLQVKAAREGLSRRRQRSALPTILALAILLALWTTSPTLREWLQDHLGGDERRAEQIDDPERKGGADERVRQEPSVAYGYAITLVLFLLLAVATGFMLWLFRREQPEGGGENVGPELLTEVERGIDDLNAISDPRAAVIACYARMEAVSAASGVAKRPSDTPFEHLGRMLERHDVDETSARRLTELFERARFSDGIIDESTRRAALAALEDVRMQLGATV